MESHSKPVVHSDPDVMGGAPVFVGTRVPFQTLLDYLEAGDPSGGLDDHQSGEPDAAAAFADTAAVRIVLMHAPSCRTARRCPAGRFELGDGRSLIVSRGVGRGLLPVRWNRAGRDPGGHDRAAAVA